MCIITLLLPYFVVMLYSAHSDKVYTYNIWGCVTVYSLFVKMTRFIYLFIYLGFYVTFNTVQVISRRVVGRAEETSTYSSLGFCTVNCRPMASNYQLSHLRPCRELNPEMTRLSASQGREWILNSH